MEGIGRDREGRIEGKTELGSKGLRQGKEGKDGVKEGI